MSRALRKLLPAEIDRLVRAIKADPDAIAARIGPGQCELAQTILLAARRLEPGPVQFYAGALYHATRSTIPGTEEPAMNFAEFGQMLHVIAAHLNLPEPDPLPVARDGSRVH